jgi:hypothetical protein
MQSGTPARSGMIKRLAFGLVIAAALIAGALELDAMYCLMGQCQMIVRVAALEYGVSLARGLTAGPGDLSEYATLANVRPVAAASQFADDTAYSLHGVDPETALVVRWAAGQSDDAGPYPPYALLIRGDWSELCQYFDPETETAPAECR